jgi:hypothetical protein
VRKACEQAGNPVRVLAACASDEMMRAKLPCVWHCGMRIARMMRWCACAASSCAGDALMLQQTRRFAGASERDWYRGRWAHLGRLRFVWSRGALLILDLLQQRPASRNCSCEIQRISKHKIIYFRIAYGQVTVQINHLN